MRFAHYWIGIAILSAMLLPGRGARADEIYDPYNSWNGYKVYLSPARHSDAGNRGECGNNNENNMAYNSSWHATNGWHYNDVYNDTSAYRNLRARGYQVRIGTGTLQSAIDNSNAWGRICIFRCTATRVEIPIVTPPIAVPSERLSFIEMETQMDKV